MRKSLNCVKKIRFWNLDHLGITIFANFSNLVNLGNLVLAIFTNLIHLVISTLVHLVHSINLVNLVLTIFGNLINMASWLIWFVWWFIWLTWFSLFWSIWLMLCIWFIWLTRFWIFGSSWICFTIQKTRKYFIETKIFIKIPIVFKNLFKSVREQVQCRKKNLTCIRKILRAIFCKSHPICDSRVFRISSYFNLLKIMVILEYG